MTSIRFMSKYFISFNYKYTKKTDGLEGLKRENHGSKILKYNFLHKKNLQCKVGGFDSYRTAL